MTESPMTLALFYAEVFAIFLVANTLASSIEVNQLHERGVVFRLARLFGLQGPKQVSLIPCRIALKAQRRRGEA